MEKSMETRKQIIVYVVALALMLSILFAGTFVVQFLSVSTKVDLASLIAISDIVRVLGPVVGGYYLGRNLPARGMFNALIVGLAAAGLFEFAERDWYFHEHWYQIVTASITQFLVPAALAGGCGELHARRSSQA
jgi:hypothetical protein